MSSSKNMGKHSRDERLAKIAQQEIIAGQPEDGAPSDEATPQTAAMPASSSDADYDNARDKFAGLDIDSAGYPLGGEPAESGSFVSNDFSEIPKKRKRRALKAFGITAGVIIGLCLVAYIAGAVVFMGRFFPNTVIGDYDISMKTDEEVIEILDGAVSSYELDVVGNGFAYQTNAEKVGLDIDSKGIVGLMHSDLDAWSWPMLIIQPNHDESNRFVVSFKQNDLKKDLNKKIKKFNKDAKPPVNAAVVYDDAEDKFIVKPEEIGEQFNAKAVNASVSDAVSSLQPALTLTVDHLKKPKVYSTDKKLIESAELATGMVSAHVTLSLNGQTVNEVDGSKLSEFISISDDFKVSFDNDALERWVTDLANGYDTIGTERNYTREDGKAITVKGGVYGWEVDTEATRNAVVEAIKGGETTEIDIPCISAAETYSGPGERDWGNRYIDVDISEQYVRFYGANGKIIWETDCITGSPDGKHDTWEGVWYVNSKESPSTLIGYDDNGKKEYETKVTYWMPFEGNGIGFHDASWQPGFGGSMYASGYGSHGCVNLAPSDAQELYSIIEIGDVVVVHS